MKKYIVVERSSRWDVFDFINDGTTGLSDIWHTHCPYKIDENEKSRLAPLVFDSKADATKYKDAQQSWASHDWDQNGMYHRMYGNKKPKWKVEEYSGELFR